MASYRKTSTGWGVRVSWRDADGELKQKYKAGFKTKNEARAAVAKAREKYVKPKLEEINQYKNKKG